MTRERTYAGPGYWNAVGAEWREGRDHLWRAHADAVNIALCRRWLQPARAGRLLKTDLFDEATGGGLIGALARFAGELTAVDQSGTIVARARSRHERLRPAVADVRTLPFTAGSFDTVVSNSTLDHFLEASEIGQALRELHRVLKPGGRLLLTLDNASHPVVALRNAVPASLLLRSGLVPYYVGRTLRAPQLIALLEETGFRAAHCTAVLHCPRVIVIPLLRAAGQAPRAARLLLHLVRLCEQAERLPTRFLTGHFLAVLAERP